MQQFGDEILGISKYSVPIAAGDRNRKLSFAASYRPQEAAIRYAKAILQRFR